MATTRVYILAKELGVKSSAIVKKCQDEGLDVKNHMTTIKAGLAATIREWFSEGEHTTTLETTERVALEKVRVKKKKRKKKEEPKEEVQPQQAEATVTEEAQVTVEEEAPAESPEEPVQVEETPVPQAEEDSGEASEEEPPAKEEEPEEEKSIRGSALIEEVVTIPEADEPVTPAGPKLEKPAPAQLNGPKVVRVEAPEPAPKPRHAPRGKRPRHDEAPVERLMQNVQSDTDEKGKKSRSKDRTHGRRSDESMEASRRAKFLSQRRQRDIEERRARLDAAMGDKFRTRPSRKITTKKKSDAGEVARPEKATVNEPITVKDLSAALAVKTNDIIAKLIAQGVMANVNQTIEPEMAELISLEFGTELTVIKRERADKEIAKEFEQRERKNLKRRPVIATMLGHVDHGKTSLLDRIRQTSVADGEAGGITQHMGAYQVSIGDRKVTFLDTPGHEAFTSMRARGANLTDVAVLVIAADDGVMPQTAEAINHAKAAGVAILIALNKIDLPGCDINRIYAQLAEHELTPVEWGGETEIVKTSATTGQGIDDLVEHLDYIADLLDLKADDTVDAYGYVVEAELSPQRGPVATCLIKEGKLQRGDVVLAGTSYGRVKTLRNSHGRSLKIATSAMPVELTGLNEVPEAGETFYCLGNDISRAKQAAEEKKNQDREMSLMQREQVTLDNLFSQIEAGKTKELNIILRADVRGSVETLQKYLADISTDEIKIKILHAATGGITEGDVILAEASNAIIIGFNVVPEDKASKLAEEKNVDIREYNIIYRITEDLKKSMSGMLEPDIEKRELGKCIIRTTFKVSRLGTIAGCYVTDGIVKKTGKVRLIRDNVVVRDDLVVDSLKHFKNDVGQVKAGLECGIKLAKFDDVKEDDVLEFFEMVEVARTLE